jgi:hypothetical protein
MISSSKLLKILGYVNFNNIFKKMMHLDLIYKSHINKKDKCEICAQAKELGNAFNPVDKKTNLLELIHSDIYDSNNVLTYSGKRYFIAYIDDFSIYCYIHLTNSKSELFYKFKFFKAEVENQLERKIKNL